MTEINITEIDRPKLVSDFNKELKLDVQIKEIDVPEDTKIAYVPKYGVDVPCMSTVDIDYLDDLITEINKAKQFLLDNKLTE